MSPGSDVLARPVAALRGVGARIAEKLARLGVRTIGNLLCLLPRRYEDRTAVRPIGSLRPGEKALVAGEIELAEVAVRRRRTLLCRVSDGTGAVTLRFFHFSSYVQQRLVRSAYVRCFGEVRAGPTGLEMVHPEWRVAARDAAASKAHASTIATKSAVLRSTSAIGNRPRFMVGGNINAEPPRLPGKLAVT